MHLACLTFAKLFFFLCLPFWYRQEVLFLDNEIVFNEAIIEEIEQGIQEIQQQIGEVNEIFKDLAVLVHDQGAMIGNSWPVPLLLLCICCLCLIREVFSLQMTSTPISRALLQQPRRRKPSCQRQPKLKSQIHLWYVSWAFPFLRASVSVNAILAR